MPLRRRASSRTAARWRTTLPPRPRTPPRRPPAATPTLPPLTRRHSSGGILAPWKLLSAVLPARPDLQARPHAPGRTLRSRSAPSRPLPPLQRWLIWPAPWSPDPCRRPPAHPPTLPMSSAHAPPRLLLTGRTTLDEGCPRPLGTSNAAAGSSTGVRADAAGGSSRRGVGLAREPCAARRGRQEAFRGQGALPLPQPPAPLLQRWLQGRLRGAAQPSCGPSQLRGGPCCTRWCRGSSDHAAAQGGPTCRVGRATALANPVYCCCR